MSSFIKQTQQQKQNYLKKIIRSLSHVSEKLTKDVRQDVNRSLNSKRRKQYHVERDSLLKKKDSFDPNLLKSERIFLTKSDKVESLKEKKIQNAASLKRVDFQYKKIKLKKQKISKKIHFSEERYHPLAKMEVFKIDPQQVRNNKISGIFEKGTIRSLTYKDKLEEAVVKRLKTTMNSSRKHLHQLYKKEEHLKTAPNHKRDDSQFKNYQLQASKFTFLTQRQDIEDTMTKTQSLIVHPQMQIKRKSLVDLIQLSTARSKDREEKLDEKMTEKQSFERSGLERTIQALKNGIEKDNKLKESLAFAGLKRILYGDRKGRFIQDNAFKTRLGGQCSQHYLNILKIQQQLLEQFNGSQFNRRNLVQKFSDILGKFHDNE